ncbi:hypothetical protein G4451_13030 [Fusicatenibacter saccharivorans]|uniref:hypothetical protein n=1 Tax=Lachnospiraceae TaxID=186803 RepID=UPI000E4A4938|nr:MULTISPECIES: hypothetical protein [Lachnospiraceae]NSE27478.1 hypothetical protein [Fusicatenibacter saccharivorans]RHV20498.1 hypothetical protein DXB71_17725 [Blautia sp. OM05-6]
MYDSILIDYGLEKAHKCYMADLDISYPFPQTNYPSIYADPSTLTEEQRVLQEKMRRLVEQVKVNEE